MTRLASRRLLRRRGGHRADGGDRLHRPPTRPRPAAPGWSGSPARPSASRSSLPEPDGTFGTAPRPSRPAYAPLDPAALQDAVRAERRGAWPGGWRCVPSSSRPPPPAATTSWRRGPSSWRSWPPPMYKGAGGPAWRQRRPRGCAMTRIAHRATGRRRARPLRLPQRETGRPTGRRVRHAKPPPKAKVGPGEGTGRDARPCRPPRRRRPRRSCMSRRARCRRRPPTRWPRSSKPSWTRTASQWTRCRGTPRCRS